ncbi:response regulator [Caenispirillum bisanense]|uniref:Two component transcriptional regulator, LuxR family n=1 Tax=Caenispirillum bisanense TaxID=414052 RepID=A0A286G8E1_9PROT|nr:response regulator transcription factor [Caenispirillum bisanense]SOD91771.1 two component transcriptional regulator, LuxR family [Caenispirillum bisanense]
MKVLLADDHTLVRQGLMPFIGLLAADVAIVEADSLDEALVKAEAERPLDLVLLDLNMPGMNRLEGLARIRSALPQTPVVILTGSVAAEDVHEAAEAGASGYIPKTLNSTAMVNALRLVLSGERYFPSFAFQTPRAPEPAAVPAAPAEDNPLGRLDGRERQIVGMMVDGATNKVIARELGLQEVTIKVHTRKIYRKLGAANRSQAIRIIMESGWAERSAAN